MDEETATVKRRLSEFTSLFDIEKDVEKYPRSHLLNVAQKLREHDWTGKTGVIRNYNLLTFLHIILREYKKATLDNEASLQVDSQNIIALTNKAWLLYRQKRNVFDIMELCDKLDDAMKDRRQVITAKAEKSYAYGCIDFAYYERALEILRHVLVEAAELQAIAPSGDHSLKADICLWKFGEALLEYRRLNLHSHRDARSINLSREKYVEVAILLSSIANSDTDSSNETVQLCRARSFVLLGHVTSSVQRNSRLFPKGTDDIEVLSQFQVLEAVDKALQICPNDPYVLERSGQLYRYQGTLNKAVELLRKAINVRESSFAYHHLALTLKADLENRCRWGRDQPGSERKNTKSAYGSSRNRNRMSTSSDEMRSRSSAQPFMASAFKSPYSIKPLDKDIFKEEIKEISDYLQKAFEFDSNFGALYDKGILFRQQNLEEEALKIFKMIVCHRSEKTSLVTLSSSYEQAGLCMKAMIAECDDRRKGIILQTDMRHFIMRSIEISCLLVAKVPFLNSSWNTLPKLKDFVEGRAESKRSVRSLDFLNEKLSSYGHELQVLSFLKRNYTSTENEMKETNRQADLYMKKRKFDDAILIFSIIFCLPDGYQRVPPETYILAHIEAALESLKVHESFLAYTRIRRALDFAAHKQSVNLSADAPEIEDDGGDENSYCNDIYLLCESDVRGKWELLVKLLRGAHLSVSLSDEVLGPRDATRHVIVVVDSEKGPTAAMLQSLQEIVCASRNSLLGGYLVVKGKAEYKVPDVLDGFPWLEIQMDKMLAEEKWSNDYVYNKTKQLLELLARPRQSS